jgi:hypothetical protein
MRPLSATECISPAIERTKLVLFTPFRKGRTWKLSAIAYLCRVGTMFLPFPLIYLFFIPAVAGAGTGAVIALCALVLVFTVIFLFIFYLCSRLQFSYLDIIVNRGQFIGPVWGKYGRRSFAWTGLKVLLGVGVTLAAALPIAAYVRHLIPVFRTLQSLTPGEQPHPEIVGAIFAGYGILLLVFGTFYLVSSLLTDFILPSLALEDTGLAEAFRRMVALVRGEPGEFLLYTVIKVVLGLAAYIAATILWEVVFLIASAIIGAVVVGIGFALHAVGVPHVVLIVLGVLIGIAWYGFGVFYALFLAIGPVLTFLDAYALYFLGGRYPLLGDLLDRSTPAPAAPYSGVYPPPYYPPAMPPPPTG